jgi:thiol:disulfide interchange protein
MQVVLTVTQMLVRITGVLLLILGLLIWTEGMRDLVFPHIILGLVMVIALWLLAVVGARLGAPMGLAASVAVMGLIVLVLGMSQNSLVPGGAHWIIQVLHLLLGMAAVGMAEALGGRLRRIRLASA